MQAEWGLKRESHLTSKADLVLAKAKIKGNKKGKMEN